MTKDGPTNIVNLLTLGVGGVGMLWRVHAYKSCTENALILKVFKKNFLSPSIDQIYDQESVYQIF